MHRLFPWLLWQAILFNFLLLRITCTNCHNSSLFLTPRILILNSLFLTPSFSWSRIYFILLSAEWTHSLLTHILSQSDLCEDYQHLPKHVTPKKNTRPMWTVLPQLVFLHPSSMVSYSCSPASHFYCTDAEFHRVPSSSTSKESL